jgi:hypothetical protein
MLSRGIQRGSVLLWGQLGAPAGQARCVGNASKLFPDGSSVQGDAYPSERGEFGQVSGMPIEVAGRTVGDTSPPVTGCNGVIAADDHVHQCTWNMPDLAVCAFRLQQCSCEPSCLWTPQAYIYAPARTASQQGQSKTATLKSKGPAWKIDFEVQQKYATLLCCSSAP